MVEGSWQERVHWFATAAVAAGALAVLVATKLNWAWLIGGGVIQAETGAGAMSPAPVSFERT